MDIEKAIQVLNTCFRPQTFPVGIKLVGSIDEIPAKAKMPVRDFGKQMALCQSIAIARRYGWVTAIGGQEMTCPVGAVTLGFFPATEKFLSGGYHIPFWGSQEVRSKIANNIPRLEHGKYAYAIVAPLERMTFEPDVVIVYGNSAQISRLMQANTLQTGEPSLSSGLGAFACSVEITRPMLTEQCQVTVPGGGERSVAQTQDHELCFSIPASKVDMIIGGLEQTHKAGTRYPIPTYLMYEAEFAPGYIEYMDDLKSTE